MVPGLELHLVKVHGAGINPGWGAGLEPPQGQTQFFQGVRQPGGGVHPVGAGVLHPLAHNGAAGEVSPGG